MAQQCRIDTSRSTRSLAPPFSSSSTSATRGDEYPRPRWRCIYPSGIRTLCRPGRGTSGSLRTAGILLFLRPRSSTSWLGLVQPAYQVEAAVTVAWSLLYRKVDAIRCPPKMQHSEAVNHRGAVAGCGARIHPTTHLSISRRNNSNPRGPLSEPGRVHGAMRNSYFLAHGLRSRSRPITQPCQRWPVPA